jgi:diketogulonate reductase-like aldo/keto reductase
MLPQIGFGTYKLSKEDIKNSLPVAIKEGYPMIDTAFLYRNQKAIGKVLSSEDLKQKKLWITTKVDLFSISDRKVEKCLSKTLTDLNKKKVNLVLLHAPSSKDNNLKAWMVLEQFQKNGYIDYIGVSNYKEDHLINLIEESKIIPYTNQIEVTPFCTRTQLVKFCQESKIIVTAHTPLTKGEKLTSEKLINIAKKYNVSPAQIMIQWSKQKGYVVIPRSSKLEHIQENIKNMNNIQNEDMILLDNLNCDFTTHPKYL